MRVPFCRVNHTYTVLPRIWAYADGTSAFHIRVQPGIVEVSLFFFFFFAQTFFVFLFFVVCRTFFPFIFVVSSTFIFHSLTFLHS